MKKFDASKIRLGDQIELLGGVPFTVSAIEEDFFTGKRRFAFKEAFGFYRISAADIEGEIIPRELVA